MSQSAWKHAITIMKLRDWHHLDLKLPQGGQWESLNFQRYVTQCLNRFEHWYKCSFKGLEDIAFQTNPRVKLWHAEECFVPCCQSPKSSRTEIGSSMLYDNLNVPRTVGRLFLQSLFEKEHAQTFHGLIDQPTLPGLLSRQFPFAEWGWLSKATEPSPAASATQSPQSQSAAVPGRTWVQKMGIHSKRLKAIESQLNSKWKNQNLFQKQ